MPCESYQDVPLVEFIIVPRIYSHARSYQEVPLAEFMCPIFARMPGESYQDVPLVEFMIVPRILLACQELPGSTFGSVYVSCICSHARLELPGSTTGGVYVPV